MEKTRITNRIGSRRGMAASLAPLFFLGACSPLLIQAPKTAPCSAVEPKQPVFDEEGLGLDGFSNEASFISFLKKYGATNIVSAKGYVNEKVVSAITSDYMKYLYIFGNGKYLGKLEIQCDSGKLPVRPFLKIVHAKGRFGVLLFADNLELNGKRISQIILIEKGGQKTYVSLTLDSLEKDNNGMTDPYVGGEDLDFGVIFCAKNNKGKAWNSVFIITAVDETVKVDKIPRRLAYDCPCFVEWAEGKDGREIFGMKL